MNLMKAFVSAVSIALLLCCVTSGLAQSGSQIIRDATQTVTMQTGDTVTFTLDLKTDDFADVAVLANEDLGLVLTVTDPDGEQLLKDEDTGESVPFVAPKTGKYTLTLMSRPSEYSPGLSGQRVTFKVGSQFAPRKNVLLSTKTINGYVIKLLNEIGEEGSTYALVTKGGILKLILKRPKPPTGGFYFKDDIRKAYTVSQKKSAALFAATSDITGEGTPDVAIEYFSGGAHCCFETTFVELGEKIHQIGPIQTASDSLTAVSRKSGGGLVLEVTDQSFAYWAIAFAMSPMPIVKYEFRGGKLVPNFDLMRKPPPSLQVLRRKAQAAKQKINDNPWVDETENFNDFEEAFWGEMLELIYSGNEELAWQYFDLVWPSKKAGKEKFLSDFKKRLDESAYGEWKRLKSNRN